MNGPLSHLRVLDLTRLQPGGYCTQLLADLGADVIKVEQPTGGDPLRRIPIGHLALARGKRSITLDLKQPQGPSVLRRLMATADVLIESQREGAMDALGVGYDSVKDEHPRLVWCALTGWGQGSPFADRPGHDITFLGHSGLLDALGGQITAGTPGLVLTVPIGAAMAVVGILAALAERERTGTGSFVDASLVDAGTWLLSENVTQALAGGEDWGESAARHPYVCADGERITLAATEARSWAALCQELGTPELADGLGGGPEEQRMMVERFSEIFATRPAAEWVKELTAAGAGIGAVNHLESLDTDAHVVARQMLVDVGGHKVVANPLRITSHGGATSSTATVPPSELGADTGEVLADCGYGPDEIEHLRSSGVV